MLAYILIILFAAMVAAWLYLRTQPELSRSRRLLLAGLRGITVAIILLLLISPIYYYRIRQKQLPTVIMLTDASQSMQLEGANGSKADYIKKHLESLRQNYRQQGYRIVEYSFADGLNGPPDNSLLAPALKEIATNQDLQNLQAIVLASDGWLRDEDLSIVGKTGIPIYSLADTSSTASPDLAITHTQNNRFAYRNEPTILRAELVSKSWSGSATLNLISGTRQLASRQVQLKDGQSQSIDFTVRFPATGFVAYRMELSAPGIPERSLANNSFPGGIEVLAEKERILLFSDKPGWDNKFILDVIGANNRWESTHYTIRDKRLYIGENATSLPSDEAVSALVIVNNGSLELSTDLIAFVQRAYNRGTGILYQGAPLAELESILPLKRSNISASYNGFLKWLPAASAYPMLDLEEDEEGKIPPVDYYYLSPSPAATVLIGIANSQNSPALAVSQAPGKGKLISMGFLNLWKWQLQGSRGAYSKMIGASLVWLSNRSESGFRAIHKSSYLRGEEVLIRLRSDDSIRSQALDLNPRLQLFDAEDKEIFADYLSRDEDEFTLGLPVQEPGTYRFRISDAESGQSSSGFFAIDETEIEARDFDYNLPLLSWISAQSGGKSVDGSYQPVPAQISQKIISGELALYRKWYLIALLIASFCLELFFRRRWSLL